MVSAEDLDKEEGETREGEHREDEDSGDDNTDGWADEREDMSEMEQKELDNDIQPIRQVLVKVSVAAVRHSTWLCGADNGSAPSSARQRTPSKTPQPLSFPAGMLSLVNSS
jgi:hypothetical protein